MREGFYNAYTNRWFKFAHLIVSKQMAIKSIEHDMHNNQQLANTGNSKHVIGSIIKHKLT